MRTDTVRRRLTRATRTDLHYLILSAGLHSMAQSAIRRRATARSIVAGARALAAEHGVDGFTMEQLAERAGVSRRTLFNYFPGKYDAILGGPPAIDPTTLATFRSGGPTGDLVEDVLVVVTQVLSEREEPPAETALGQRLLHDNPQLIAYAMTQLDACLGDLQEHLTMRGSAYRISPGTARALLATLVAIGHVAMADFVETDGAQPLHELYSQRLRGLRSALI